VLLQDSIRAYDSGSGRNVLRDDRICADRSAPTDQNRAQYFCTGPYVDAILNTRSNRNHHIATANSHLVPDNDVFAYLSGTVNNYSQGMGQKDSSGQRQAYVAPKKIHIKTRQHWHAMASEDNQYPSSLAIADPGILRMRAHSCFKDSEWS
jgi:hypothetical protein